MLKELLRNTKLMSKVNVLIKKNKDKILDIILFGSFVKGKEKPRDIDLLVIYKTKIDSELDYKIKKEFEVFSFEVDLVSKIYNDLFKSTFLARESYLSEGYSLIQKKFISDGLGYKPMVLFRYDIRHFNKSQRMRFYYSLYGRNSEGILKKLKLYKFSERVIMAPVEESERVKEYFSTWGIKYLEIPILIPLRIVESEVFKGK